MKKTLVLGSLILLSFTHKPGSYYRNDLEKYGLNGPVQSLTEYRCEYKLVDGEPQITKRIPVQMRIFNVLGNIEEMRRYDHQGNVNQVDQYIYNSNGKPSVKNMLDAQLNLRAYMLYEYDSEGRIQREIGMDTLKRIQWEWYTIYAGQRTIFGDMFTDSCSLSNISFLFNYADCPDDSMNNKPDGFRLACHETKITEIYTADSMLVSKTVDHGYNMNPTTRSYQYDEFGNLIETVSGIAYGEERNTYNALGNCLEMKVVVSKNRYKVITYQYTYDSRYNAVSRREFNDGALVSVYQSEIAYRE